MLCCELCEETVECTQKEIHGELLDICERCPLAVPLGVNAESHPTVERSQEDEETLI
jgi:hypothetical protein